MGPSRPSALSNLWTGVPLVSRSVSTTNLQLLFLVVIWPRFNVPSACCPTPLPLLRLGLVLITSSTSCMPNVPLFIGMLEKVWKRVSSLRPVKIWLPSKRIMRKLVLTPWRLKVMKEMNTNLKKKSSNHLWRSSNSQFSISLFDWLGNSINILYMMILICLCNLYNSHYHQNYSAYLHTNLAL